MILHCLTAPVELADLQDLCREAVRSLLRSNIEHEHPDLANAAIKPVQKRSVPRDRRQIRRIVVPYVPVPPFYESDDDPRMMSDDENEEEQRHRVSQLTAFIELARNLAGQRHANRGYDRDDEEQENEDQEDQEVDLDGLEEDKEEEHEEEDETDPPAEPAATKSGCPEETCGCTDLPEGKQVDTGHPEENSGTETVAAELATQVFSHKEEEDKLGKQSAATESSIEDAEKPTPSVSALTQSAPIPMTSTPVMPTKSSKKREKFDSGVGDEIENGKGPSSESDEDDGDVDMDIDSTDSDYSDNSAPRTKFTRLLDPDDPNCACGENCGEAFKARRGEEETQEEDETHNRKKESATEMYSTHMREKINLLPLPLALKLYLNYNREL